VKQAMLTTHELPLEFSDIRLLGKILKVNFSALEFLIRQSRTSMPVKEKETRNILHGKTNHT
jgi:hypothetical protein